MLAQAAAVIVASCQPDYSQTWDHAAVTNNFISAITSRDTKQLGRLIAPGARAFDLSDGTSSLLAGEVDEFPKNMNVTASMKTEDTVSLLVTVDSDPEPELLTLRFKGGCIVGAAS